MQYVTNERGERVGVLLDLAVYQRLANSSNFDPECLVDLNIDELQALAQSQLATVSQTRLNELLSQNHEDRLSIDEIVK